VLAESGGIAINIEPVIIYGDVLKIGDSMKEWTARFAET
jgi:hypothetical protein